MPPNGTNGSNNDWPTENNDETQTPNDFEATEHIDWTPKSPSYFETEVGNNSGFEYNVHSFFKFDELPLQFAGYTLLEKIGEGGAGIVFLATPDPENASANGYETVALKMMRPETLVRGRAVQRFEKESRLHSEIECPFVTKHLEFGSERGVFYISSEFVEGCSLDKIIGRFSKLPAEESLRIVVDLLKALASMHTSGLIHRDVKPANIIVNFKTQPNSDVQSKPDDSDLGEFVIAKLTDFGLARHVDQSESLAMTRQQTMLGTPLYMAPEQHFESRAVDARADVYSTGVTLYQMLAGHPPFESTEQIDLADLHRVEHPVSLTNVRPDISEAVDSIVMKAMEKDPNLRYQHADDMLADVERILDNQPISLRSHLEAPDAFDPAVKHYNFEWTLNAQASQLWPLVADTDRFNRAIGLPAANFRYDHSGGQLSIFGDTKFNGMKVRWREHPFQWIYEREMSILREFESGPFEWINSTVELHPLASQKTRLVHRIEVKPRGWFGKLFTPLQFNVLTKRSLDKVYPRLEKIANDQSCGYACDFSFGADPKLSKAQTVLLDERIEKLGRSINNMQLAWELGDFIRRVADPMAARIRPLTLAAKLNCSQEQILHACYSSIEAGLLNFSWDIICPVCRVAADNFGSLQQIESHVHCQVCNLDFQPNFADSVEAIFSVHPEIRSVELKTYCIGGPFHAPHVLAQNRLLASQRVDVGVVLKAGRYGITGPQLNVVGKLNVMDEGVESRAEFVIGGDVDLELPTLCSGNACVSFENQSDMDVLVRLEQRSNRENALSATIASQHLLFRKLFPNDVKTVEQLVGLSKVYLLAIRHTNADALIEQVGDVQVRQSWNQLQQLIPSSQAGCEIVECTHESLTVSFDLLDDLLSSLLAIRSDRQDNSIPVDECCFAILSGQVMTATTANQPKTFGKTVRCSKEVLAGLSKNELIMPSDVHEMLCQSDAVNTEPTEEPDSGSPQSPSATTPRQQLLQRCVLSDEANADGAYVKLLFRKQA